MCIGQIALRNLLNVNYRIKENPWCILKNDLNINSGSIVEDADISLFQNNNALSSFYIGGVNVSSDLSKISKNNIIKI